MMTTQPNRFRISSVVAIVTLAFSLATLAQNSVLPTALEMAAIHKYFDVTPDDPSVFRIKGRAVTAGEYPRHLTGMLTMAPYLFSGSMCVLETIRHWAEVINSEIVWAETEPSKSLTVWLLNNPDDCHMIDPNNIPDSVWVQTVLIGHETLLQILRLEDEILMRAANKSGGSAYTASGYRISRISLARKDLERDLGDFCMRYSAPNVLTGPSICIEFEGQELVIKSAGIWIS